MENLNDTELNVVLMISDIDELKTLSKRIFDSLTFDDKMALMDRIKRRFFGDKSND